MRRLARTWGLALCTVGAVGAAGLLAGVARAQEGATREREAAAEAFDKGSAAYLQGDFATAGKWFETAYRMAPNSAALLQAVRAYEHAEDLPRAATLALAIMQAHSGDDEAVKYAEGVLEELSPHMFRVDVVCESCRLELDGELQEHTSFFVEPGVSYELVAEFDTGRRRGNIKGKPGETRVVELTAPERGAAETAGMAAILGDTSTIDEPYEPDTEPEPEDEPEPDDDGKPFGPPVPIVGIALTVAVAGVAIWSTIDMNAGVEEYEDAVQAALDCRANCMDLEDEARQLLEDGQGKETRSTVLWAATGGTAAVTLIIAAFLTDWGGGESDEASLRLQLASTPERAGAVVSGSF